MSAKSTGLRKDSVADVSQVTPVDRVKSQERVGVPSRCKRAAALDGVAVVLGRSALGPPEPHCSHASFRSNVAVP